VKGLAVLRGRAVRTAAVDVADRGARVVGAPVLLADLVGQERQARLLGARHLGADARDRHEERVRQDPLRCFASGTTQVPVARATTRGDSRSRAADPSSDATTFRASKRISREVLPLRTISASTSR